MNSFEYDYGKLVSERKSRDISVEKHRQDYANAMMNGIGDDITAVLSGEKVYKVKLKDRMMIRFRQFINRLFRVI